MRSNRPGLQAGAHRLLVFACVGLLIASCKKVDGPIRIGMTGPLLLKGSGDLLHGAELAVAEANAEGGLNGRQFELAVAADGGNAEKAAGVAERFVRDESIIAVDGHMTSGTVLATAQLYHGHLAAVATMASSPALTNLSPWVFRVAESDAALGADLARFTIGKGWRRVAVLYQNDPYGRDLTTAFSNAHTAAGGVTVATDPISIAADTAGNFGVFLRTYEQRRPDAVLLVTSPGIGIKFLNEAAVRKLNIPVIGSDGWPPEEFAPEPSAEGVYIPSAFLSDDSDAVASAFRARFRVRYGHEPSVFGAMSYDAALVIIAAIRSAGPDRARVRDVLASDQLSPVHGVTGPISFKTGDRAQKFGGLVRIENGKVQTYLRWKEVDSTARAPTGSR